MGKDDIGVVTKPESLTARQVSLCFKSRGNDAEVDGEEPARDKCGRNRREATYLRYCGKHVKHQWNWCATSSRAGPRGAAKSARAEMCVSHAVVCCDWRWDCDGLPRA